MFSFLSKKKLITISSVFFLICTLLLLIFFLNAQEERFTKPIEKTKSIAGNPDIEAQLNTVKNKKLSSELRYKALKNVVFSFKAEYFREHNPYLRNYILEDLNIFAKNNFKEEYNEDDFTVSCSDPQCGQKLNPELQKILTIMDKSKAPDDEMSTLRKNFLTAAYSPEEDKEQIVFGLELTIDQLEETGYKEASEAALLLRAYIKKEYNRDYVKFEYETPN